MSVKAYIGGFRKKAAEHAKKTRANALHPYDWKIAYREINENTFEIDITECAMLKLAKDFDVLGMYPAICRMDYLFSHYMGNGFERTKTLGDGDECCNCRYHIVGNCEWSPEKGFESRR
ncbi:MAG: L-2-amino-thiazoline-4-carboxylic acid hydrolase [Syntrophomonas sp.]